jgi:hypothetical protein
MPSLPLGLGSGLFLGSGSSVLSMLPSPFIPWGPGFFLGSGVYLPPLPSPRLGPT